MTTGMPKKTGMTIAVLGATGVVGSRVVTEAGTRGHQVLALSRKPASEHSHVTPIPVDATDAAAVREALAGSATNGALYGAPGGASYGAPGGASYGAPGGASYGAPDGASNGAPDGASNGAPDGASNGAPDGASYGAADAVVLAVRTSPVDRDFLVAATRTVLDAAAQLGMRVLVVGGAGALRSPGDPELPVADNPAYVPAELRAVAAAGIAQLRTCQAHPDADWVYLSPPALLEPGQRTGCYRRGTDTLLTGADGRSWISAEDLAAAVVDELETPGPERHITVVHHDERRDPKTPPLSHNTSAPVTRVAMGRDEDGGDRARSR